MYRLYIPVEEMGIIKKVDLKSANYLLTVVAYSANGNNVVLFAACALIFMIAVVLLVSAICKMQMKRAALRTYTHADRAARQHYSVQYHQVRLAAVLLLLPAPRRSRPGRRAACVTYTVVYCT